MRQQNIIGEFSEALNLKKNILRCHLLLAVLYIAIIVVGLCVHDSILVRLQVLRTESTSEAYIKYLSKILLSKELTEILLIGCIIINVRPRLWPRYYTLDVAYDPLIG